MKRAFTFAILFMFVFLLGGQMVVYLACIYTNKIAMNESIRKGTFTGREFVLTISNQSSDTIIEGNELTWQGHRLDIIKVEKKPGKMVIHAINDEVEENLLTGIGNQFSGFSQKIPANHKTAQILKDFFKEYTAAESCKTDCLNHVIIPNYQYQNLSIQDGFLTYSTPPPKFFKV